MVSGSASAAASTSAAAFGSASASTSSSATARGSVIFYSNSVRVSTGVASMAASASAGSPFDSSTGSEVEGTVESDGGSKIASCASMKAVRTFYRSLLAFCLLKAMKLLDYSALIFSSN